MTLIGGDVLSLAVFVLSQMGYIELHFTIIAGILRALCLGLLVVASLALGDAPAPEKIDDLTWASRAFETGPSMAWYQKLSGSCGRCARPDGGDARRVLVTRRPSVDGGPPFLGSRFVGLVAALQLRGEEA